MTKTVLSLVVVVLLFHATQGASAKAEVYDHEPDEMGGHIGGGDAHLHRYSGHGMSPSMQMQGQKAKRVRRRRMSNNPFLFPAPFLKRGDGAVFKAPAPPRIRRRVPKGREQAPPTAPTSFILVVKPGRKVEKRRINARRLSHADLIRRHHRRRMRIIRRKYRRAQRHMRIPVHRPLTMHGKGGKRGRVHDNDYDIHDEGDELDLDDD